MVTPREFTVGMEFNSADGKDETWIVESLVSMEEDGREKVMVVLTPLDSQQAVSAEYDNQEIDTMERAANDRREVRKREMLNRGNPTDTFDTAWVPQNTRGG